jgi:hypothetical protein
MGSPNCFKYDKPGHFLKDGSMNLAESLRPQGDGSQQQYPTQARVYSLTPGVIEEVEEYTDVAAGTIS